MTACRQKAASHPFSWSFEALKTYGADKRSKKEKPWAIKHMEGIESRPLHVVLKFMTFAFRIRIGGLFIDAGILKIADPGAG